MNKCGTLFYFSRLSVLLVVISSLLFISCSEDEDVDETDLSDSITVEAVDQRMGSLPLVHRSTGEMRARNQVDIYPEITARITDVFVNDGDRVSEGDTLVKLRDNQIREQLNQAQYDYEIAQSQLRQSEADLRRLEAQFQRVRELQERDLETALELETLEADMDAAEASVDLARSQMERSGSEVEEQRSNLENTVVQSPVDGMVGNRDAEVGQQANSNERLFQVGDTDNMRIHVMLTENMSGVIQQGDRAELVSSSGDNNPVEATVERISPFLDPVTHTTIAQLEVHENSANLRAGMFVTVDIFYGETDQATLIPKTAIYEHPVEGLTGVYVADMSGVETEFEFDEDEEQELRVTPSQVPIQFLPIEVIAEGRGVAGVSGIDDEDLWVVTIGQHQIAEWDRDEAFVREVSWEHVMDLQNRQARDMESIIFGNNNE